MLAWPRVVDTFHRRGVQDGVHMNLLHLVAGDAERTGSVRLGQERLVATISRNRVGVVGMGGR